MGITSLFTLPVVRIVDSFVLQEVDMPAAASVEEEKQRKELIGKCMSIAGRMHAPTNMRVWCQRNDTTDMRFVVTLYVRENAQLKHTYTSSGVTLLAALDGLHRALDTIEAFAQG